ncbi:hypothetical protein E4L96_07665 [Massilia arenosa]|uniref:DUF2116 family Zn-ribbon domain-containing protein n=1 Tax=Zemynaea arenosa TaxID=2561931 RepID=A0A4Y9SJS3_9BURK|nr:hypothetical protein [Massilia arenosa]TFW22601.1 hypothetical protein E4L96_07665 [Massilia arenosa]
MGTLQEGLPEPDPAVMMAAPGQPLRQSLPPKGACWYCDKPLDSVKRFCGKNCADAFEEEAELFNHR